MTDKQARRNEKQLKETALKSALAFEFAKRYCEENGYSVDKLKKQRINCIYNTVIFAQPSDIVPDGLLNDMETIPLPTLILEANAGVLEVKQTEYTQKYLAN